MFKVDGIETFILKITLPKKLKDDVTLEVVDLEKELRRSLYRRGENKNPDDPALTAPQLKAAADKQLTSIVLNGWLEGTRQLREERLASLLAAIVPAAVPE